MSNLFNAMRGNTYSRTQNGAITLADSGNSLVDLFGMVGSSRGKDISGVFIKAFNGSEIDNILATRIMLWSRDVRGGAGERDTFRKLLVILERENKDLCKAVVRKIPEIGRWDDVLSLRTDGMRRFAFGLVQDALFSGNGLCAKWMPRKGAVAVELRRFLGMSPKEYRKTLVRLTNVVETPMCAKAWEDINYQHVPSVASSRYAKAFMRNDEARYRAYLGALEKGTAKVNAGAIFPYDVIRGLNRNQALSNAQWDALPDYLEGSTENLLCVVDTSGSMGCGINGSGYYGASGPSCMDVALSLGLYISERSKGIFKDSFITFSGNPSLQTVSGTLQQRYNQMKRADWAMNTNLQAVFNLILKAAVRANLPEKDMPTKILIFSDMEFDSATRRNDRTNFQAIEEKYKSAGYSRPDIVFWNLNAREGNSPVRFDKSGTALVSGFSPSLMKSILSGKNVTPFSMMMDTIMNERYDLDI